MGGVTALKVVNGPGQAQYNSDLFHRQAIELVQQPVDLAVGGLDLALVELLAGEDGASGQSAFSSSSLDPSSQNRVSAPQACAAVKAIFLLSYFPS